MAIRHLSALSNSDEIVEVIRKDGLVVVDHLVSPASMDAIAAELGPRIEVSPFCPDDFTGRRTKRIGGLIARSQGCRELIMHPVITAVATGLLNRASCFQLHLTQAIVIMPGETSQPVHRDQWAFDFFEFPKDYEVLCNVIWALTDFTEENGATRVIPGSHSFDEGLKFQLADTEYVEMKKGSALLYGGRLYHGGGPNRTNDARIGVNISYSVAWLRQEENQYLSVPLDVARTLSDEFLMLIGYRRGAYGLGYVDDLRDPMEIVRSDCQKEWGDEAAINDRRRQLESNLKERSNK